MNIKIRKFRDGQEYVSASSLMVVLLDYSKARTQLLSVDLKEESAAAFQFDSGYLAALNDIMYQLMLDPSEGDIKGEESEGVNDE